MTNLPAYYTELLAILANVMFCEASLLDSAAMEAVGHVYLNRFIASPTYGTTPLEVARAFHAYNTKRYVPEGVIQIADTLILMLTSNTRTYQDPTYGSLFILSHQDIDKLWPHRANCIRRIARWRSRLKVKDGVTYRLYAFGVWPDTLPSNHPMCKGL